MGKLKAIHEQFIQVHGNDVPVEMRIIPVPNPIYFVPIPIVIFVTY